MAEKITISSDEVNCAAVDEKLRQTAAENPYRSPGAEESGGIRWSQIIYNSLVYSTLFGLVGGILAGMLGELFWLVMMEASVPSLVFLWPTSVGMLLAFCLSIADEAMGQNLRGVMINGSIAIAVALVGTLFGGCIAGIVYSSMGGGEFGVSFALQVFARAVGWGLFGGFLAIAPGIALKNWKRLIIGLAGGLIGGALGGALFDPIAEITQNGVLSRFVGITVIGALTGLGTGLLETAAKTGWVRVTQGLIAGKQFILYKDTTNIGSSPQCEIYLFKDTEISPRHAAIHKRGNRHEIEDLRSATGTFVNGSPITKTRLNKGDQIRIGSTVLVFQERARKS